MYTTIQVFAAERFVYRVHLIGNLNPDAFRFLKMSPKACPFSSKQLAGDLLSFVSVAGSLFKKESTKLGRTKLGWSSAIPSPCHAGLPKVAAHGPPHFLLLCIY
jgi:hypothetical protein